jgi:arylsulfatase A-like enzyme
MYALFAMETNDAAGAPRPNFVLMIADDMAWDDSGPYGHESIRTPNLNRLAAGGMRFDRAFLTCSSCSPSRASIITGRYPHNTDAEQLHWPLPAEQTTFVERLRQSGYWTASAGKWHLGDAIKDRFDVVHEADTLGFQLPTGPEGDAGRFIQRGSGDVKSGCADWVRTLRERPRGKPFLVWLAALDPHRDYEPGIIDSPHRPEDAVVPPYLPDVREVRKELALYYDEIARLDQFVGDVLAELERQDVAENTFVLFFSDNGRPFPRDKTTLYDSGIRTPWIVRFPGRVKSGSVCDRLVSSVDIAPTLCELADVPLAESFEGRSFVSLLDDRSSSIRRYAFAEKHWHDYEDQCRAVRSESFKYIRNLYNDLPGTPPADGVRSPTYRAMQELRDQGRLASEQMACFIRPRPAEELYDIRTDPFELQNLAGKQAYAAVLDEMREAMAEWQRVTGDQLPNLRTADEFDRELGTPLPNRVRPRPSKREMFGP